MTELTRYQKLGVDTQKLAELYEHRNDGLSVIIAAKQTQGFERVDCAKEGLFRIVYLQTPEGSLAFTFPWRDPVSRELEGPVQVRGDTVSVSVAQEYVDEFCKQYERAKEHMLQVHESHVPKRRSRLPNFWWAFEHFDL